jgi:hypothetical protein
VDFFKTLDFLRQVSAQLMNDYKTKAFGQYPWPTGCVKIALYGFGCNRRSGCIRAWHFADFPMHCLC